MTYSSFILTLLIQDSLQIVAYMIQTEFPFSLHLRTTNVLTELHVRTSQTISKSNYKYFGLLAWVCNLHVNRSGIALIHLL